MFIFEIIFLMNENIYQRVGKKIRSIRQSMGISQEALAFKADVHPSFISHIERGAKKASLETIQKLADALGVPVEELFITSEKTTYPSNQEDLFIRKIATLIKDKDDDLKYILWQLMKYIDKEKKE